MRRLMTILCLMMAGMALPAADDGLKAYDILIERNIFSPTRGVRRVEETVRVPLPEPPPPVRVDAVTLTGVAVIDGEARALFAGTQEALHGTRRAGEELAGMVIVTITTSGVTLSGEDGEVHLPVGGTLTRKGDAPWQLDAEAVAVRATVSTSSSASTSTSSASSPTSSSGSGSSNDILQRLRERRQQEMNQ